MIENKGIGDDRECRETHDDETECFTHVGEKWVDCACDKHPQKYNPVLGWFDVD